MLLVNWHFDIFNGGHWKIAYDLWRGGWTIRHAKEWAFVLIIISFIPLWLTGWATLSHIPWEDFIASIVRYMTNLIKFMIKDIPFPDAPESIAKIATVTSIIQTKKSYKEVRPRSLRPITEASDSTNSAPAAPIAPPPSFATKPLKTEPINFNPPGPMAPKTRAAAPAAPQAAAPSSNFDHSLFKFDGENEDFSFDIDAFDEKKPEPAIEPEPAYVPPPRSDKTTLKTTNDQTHPERPAPERGKPQSSKPAPAVKAGGNSVLDAIKQKGYEVLTNTVIKGIDIDFIGLSSKEIHLFLVDKEPGDWLADEERFNDEEPLWFSESSHRISPVRKIEIARTHLQHKLKEYDLRYNLKAHVVIALGNIINAEDMFDIWNGMNIEVSRIDRGSPKELKLFAKALPDAIDSINKDKLEKIKKLIKNIG